MARINFSHWTPVGIDSLFAGSNTGNILARDVEDGTGDTPYVTASGINNGVVAHIDARSYPIVKGNCILVGGKTFTLTYQKEDFVSNDSHNFELHLKDSSKATEQVYLFFIVALKATLSQRFSWGDAVTIDKMLNAKVYLPTTKNGRPDFDYIESFMASMQKRVEHIVNLLCNINCGDLDGKNQGLKGDRCE